MVAIPSGTPIPTPMAIGRLVDGSWVWTGTWGSVDVLVEESAETVDPFELGRTEKVVVTRMLVALVRADDAGVTDGECEGVTGGNPKMEPVVYGTKLAWMPV